MTGTSLFISYSHKDEEWKNRLVTHLGVLKWAGILDLWEDRRIEAGADWYAEIENAINTADMAILMISADFLNSKFINEEEVSRLLKRRKEAGLRIIPVIVKPCAWTVVHWLSGIQARPKDGRALSMGNDGQIDTDLSTLAQEIAHLIGHVHQEPKKEAAGNFKSAGIEDDHLEKRIKHWINFGDYEKALTECSGILDANPENPLINLLITIAILKGRGADRYQTTTIKKIEGHLSNACDDEKYYPTALMAWGLIKYDHYQVNGLRQEKPYLEDIKKSLSQIDVELIDLSLVEKIKASQGAWRYFDLVHFFPG